MSVLTTARTANGVKTRSTRASLARLVAQRQPQVLIALVFVVSRFAFREAAVVRDSRPINDAF